MSGSQILRGGAGEWAQVAPTRYKAVGKMSGRFLGVARHALLGQSGADTTDGMSFELRYFEIEPRGYTSLEHHAHAHAVMVVKGRGRVRLGKSTRHLSAFDVVYVAPGEVHRFFAGAREPLGFFCVVDRLRDRPVPVNREKGTLRRTLDPGIGKRRSV